MNLPDGYNTYVREQGKNFSGGQRQRLTIARAILRDAPILILDEPTASLDVEAEAEVMHALDTLVVGRTVLVISHRLSTLGNVDEIIVLSGGQIVEKGTYKELRRAGGVFANLLEEQNRYSAEQAEKSILRSAFAPLPKDFEQRLIPPSPVAQPNWPAPARPTPPPLAPINGGSPRGDGNSQPGRTPRVVIEVNGAIIGSRQLDKPILTVGRLTGNDVQIPSQRVSRLHARIRWENSRWLRVWDILYHLQPIQWNRRREADRQLYDQECQ